MKRMHVNVEVADLDRAIAFYRTLFAAPPTVHEHDYAKWMLEDPRVNFAVSTRGQGGRTGLGHLGIQVEEEAELAEAAGRLRDAAVHLLEERDAACCYARSDKAWSVDPAGLLWETFHTHGSSTEYGEDRADIGELVAAGGAPGRGPASAEDAAGTSDPTAAGTACCGPATGR